MENSTGFLSTLLFLATALFYVHFFKSKKSLYPLPPGPKPWPIVGNLPEMLKNKPTFRWIHELMKEMNTDIACIRFGNVHVIPVTCPEISREFLRKQDALFASRPISMSTEMTSKGWFHMKRIEEADHLIRYVYEQCKNVSESGGGLVKVRVAAQQYCGNVIRKMVFNKRFFGEGAEDGGPGLEEEEHIDAIFKVLAYMYSFCVSDYVPCLRGVVDLDDHEKVMKENIGIIDRYHDPIIEERILELRDHHGLIKKEVDHEDLLDVLITLKDEDGNPLLSTEEIKAQITELMLATVDNPSNAVEWALAEMINQPKILEKAIEELDRVVGKERLVQESDFSQLNYIKACAREAFRLHPIAPFNVPHVARSDTTVANYFIPKGSHVLLSRSGLGRNPKAWPDETLNTGRRGCIGVTLGTSMTVMLFARLLQGFTWTAPPNESKIDLSEAEDSLALAKPQIAVAKPRLAKHVYPAAET
ncbi:hypothetical protein EZV62_026182 [Acer yangbiense]|uniref:Cytochrome P450 n=1 Tax=Acer yangbiense TaxID=1000413 RepID=A0A5C7GQF5_9ROSI|nr:hypothetical protein EZV62_026182 [Acer yangbiense]